VKPLALCLVLGLTLLGGCGQDDEGAAPPPSAPTEAPSTTAPVTVPAPTTETQPPATEPESVPTEEGAPTEPPPDQPESGAPPPAWVETTAGRVWLAYGSYCWTNACVDMVQVTCDDASTPAVQAETGETVRFHLGFRPTEATLSVEDSTPEALPRRRTIAWSANRGGLLRLDLRAAGGDASYVACVTLLGV